MANDKQKTYWTEVAAPKWLSLEGAMEARLAPVSDAVIEAAGLKPESACSISGAARGAPARKPRARWVRQAMCSASISPRR